MTERITSAQFRGLAVTGTGAKRPPRSKYGNRKVKVDGISFDSVKESRRYSALKLLEKAGEIRNLRLQVPYRLEVNGELVCNYVADFVYQEKGPPKPPLRLMLVPEALTIEDPFDAEYPDCTVDHYGPSWKTVVEDTKGFRTPEYRIKAKLMLACHRITIRET